MTERKVGDKVRFIGASGEITRGEIDQIDVGEVYRVLYDAGLFKSNMRHKWLTESDILKETKT